MKYINAQLRSYLQLPFWLCLKWQPSPSCSVGYLFDEKTMEQFLWRGSPVMVNEDASADMLPVFRLSSSLIAFWNVLPSTGAFSLNMAANTAKTKPDTALLRLVWLLSVNSITWQLWKFSRSWGFDSEEALTCNNDGKRNGYWGNKYTYPHINLLKRIF